MTSKKTVLIDYGGPFPELCARLMEAAGFDIKPAGAGWPEGIPLVRGLDGPSVGMFPRSSDSPGPLVAVVHLKDIADESIVESAGAAHAYCIVEDQAAVLRATVLAAFKRWAIEKRLSESEAGYRAALAERDTLMRELGHRVKNTLSLTSSLLSLAKVQARDEEDAELFEESKSRVQAMALLYDKLLKSGSHELVGLNSYLKELCTGIIEAYAPGDTARAEADSVAFNLDADGLLIDSSRAVSMGLVVNEALTNALKYGRLPQKPLRLRIGASRKGERIVITVEDNGPGLEPGFLPESAGGLGFQLLEALTLQLGGSFRLVPVESGGLRIEFDIPC